MVGGNIKDIELINDDAVEVLKHMKDKSVDLILIDPPYNIGKASWDKIDNYIGWLGGIFEELSRVLKDNGSFYFFHNDFLQIVELQNYINKHTDFIFKRLIVWNKKFKGSKLEGYLQGHLEVKQLRNYKQMVEYCLFYTKQDATGLETIMLDVNNFKNLRDYFKDLQEWLGLKLSETNKILGNRRAEHTFYHSSTQWDLCTEETYKALEEQFKIRVWSGYRTYEDLRQEYEGLRQGYESLRYTFNNQKTHHSVWNYNVAEKQGHITPKPVDLLENILKHSSNKGDLVLDCFMGSGSTGVACKNLGRKFIGIELDEDYFKIAKDRIEGVI